MQERAAFTDMESSTAEDWQLIATDFARFAHKLPDRILAHLMLLDGDFAGFR